MTADVLKTEDMQTSDLCYSMYHCFVPVWILFNPVRIQCLRCHVNTQSGNATWATLPLTKLFGYV